MKELKRIYQKISKQTQNRLQEIFDSFNLDFNNLYSIADNKTKNRIDAYIEEWKDKKLLTGYFGTLANSIYKRTKVKNNEILELLIYSAYIEEQSKLKEKELNIFKEDANYYYQEGQKEVNREKTVSIIPDAVFLSLLDMTNSKGYNWNEYIETITKFNAEQIYRQSIIDIQQQKQIDVYNDVYQSLIARQQNAKLNINEDKIYGNVDLTLIGINNKAKEQGIYSFDSKAEVELVSIEDEKTTKMCKSLNGQRFKIHDWNEFERYSESNGRITKYRCYGLIIGLNCPPIDDNFHWCRSILKYVEPVEKEENVTFDEKGNVIINGLKILNNEELRKINRIALLENLNRMERVFKDFPMIKDRKIKYKVVKRNDNSAMAVTPTKKGNYILEINENVFDSNIKQFYKEGIKQHTNVKGTTYKDIAIHETGHMASFEIIKKINKNNLQSMKFDYDNFITSNNIVEKSFNNLKVYDKMQKEKLITNISNYALTNSDETIAEAFADYYSNKEKANILSKEIIRVMKGMMKN